MSLDNRENESTTRALEEPDIAGKGITDRTEPINNESLTKRRKIMRTNQSVARIKMLLATLVMSLLCVGTVQAQSPVFRGKFTLPCQVHWGTGVLQPGDYTITIQSSAMPMMASILKADGNGGIFVMTRGVRSEQPRGLNALLVFDKDGEPTVHSLSLADVGIVLIYDPSLARESVKEARVSRTVPVMWAKK